MGVMRHLYDAPGFGVGEIWTRDGMIVQHELASTTLRPGGDQALETGRPPVHDLCRRIVSHLAGAPTSYDDVLIDMAWATAFQRDLAAAARAVPWGEVVSYGELAALAGRPGAARAAGSFCAENRYSLIIPCHRVVAAGGIGGYGPGGLDLKRRLLALEGLAL